MGKSEIPFQSCFTKFKGDSRCSYCMVAFIEDPDVIEKIPNHLNSCTLKRPERPVAYAPPLIEDAAYDKPLATSAEDYVAEPVYPMGA